MMKHFFSEDINLNKRGFLVLSMFYIPGFSWCILFYTYLSGISAPNLATVVFSFSVIFSILVSRFFINKSLRLLPIYVWAGTMPVAVSLLVFASNVFYASVSVFLGVTYGLSMLTYSVFFCGLTAVEERGRVGGAITFITLLIYPVLSLLANVVGYLGTFILIGFLPFLAGLLKPKSLTVKKTCNSPRTYRHETVLLYLIPWITSCLINGTLAIIPATYYSNFADIAFQAFIMKYLAACFGAILGGVLADWMGRRSALIIGLTFFGISHALSGFVGFSGSAFLMWKTTSGLSWGMFQALYLMIVWGDLASWRNPAPFYAVGLAPFFLYIGIGKLFTHDILQIPPNSAAFLSSILTFVSNVPLIFAKELLPEHILEERNDRLYIEQVKKFWERWNKKIS